MALRPRRAQLSADDRIPSRSPIFCQRGDSPYRSVAMPAGHTAVTLTPRSRTSFEKATEKLFK